MFYCIDVDSHRYFASYLALYKTKGPLLGLVAMSPQIKPGQLQAFSPPIEYIF